MKIASSLILYMFLSFNASGFCQNVTIENTGLYGVYVKSMPFWTFWNYDTALEAIAIVSDQSIDDVSATIKKSMPILYTRNYEAAMEFKRTLLKFNCDLEIREMKFVLDNEQAVKEFELQQEFLKDAAFFDSLQDDDLVTARQKIIEHLKNKCTE